MSDVILETIDGRPTLRFTCDVTATIDEVWRAVSEPGVVGEWFIPTRPWKKVTELDELLGEVQGVPVSSEPRTQVTWGSDDDVFIFRVAEVGGGVRVELLVPLDDPAEAAIEAMTIGGFFDRLAPYLAGEETSYAALGDLDSRAELLEAYAIRLGVDPAPGREWVAQIRAARAADDGEDESGYQPDPDAVERMEEAMTAYLREHKAAFDAAMLRAGADGAAPLMARLEDWILPVVTTTAEFMERYFFLLDRFVANQSLSLVDVESAWRASHPEV